MNEIVAHLMDSPSYDELLLEYQYLKSELDKVDSNSEDQNDEDLDEDINELELRKIALESAAINLKKNANYVHDYDRPTYSPPIEFIGHDIDQRNLAVETGKISQQITQTLTNPLNKNDTITLIYNFFRNECNFTDLDYQYTTKIYNEFFGPNSNGTVTIDKNNELESECTEAPHNVPKTIPQQLPSIQPSDPDKKISLKFSKEVKKVSSPVKKTQVLGKYFNDEMLPVIDPKKSDSLLDYLIKYDERQDVVKGGKGHSKETRVSKRKSISPESKNKITKNQKKHTDNGSLSPDLIIIDLVAPSPKRIDDANITDILVSQASNIKENKKGAKNSFRLSEIPLPPPLPPTPDRGDNEYYIVVPPPPDIPASPKDIESKKLSDKFGTQTEHLHLQHVNQGTKQLENGHIYNVSLQQIISPISSTDFADMDYVAVSDQENDIFILHAKQSNVDETHGNFLDPDTELTSKPDSKIYVNYGDKKDECQIRNNTLINSIFSEANIEINNDVFSESDTQSKKNTMQYSYSNVIETYTDIQFEKEKTPLLLPTNINYSQLNNKNDALVTHDVTDAITISAPISHHYNAKSFEDMYALSDNRYIPTYKPSAIVSLKSNAYKETRTVKLPKQTTLTSSMAHTKSCYTNNHAFNIDRLTKSFPTLPIEDKVEMMKKFQAIKRKHEPFIIRLAQDSSSESESESKTQLKTHKPVNPILRTPDYISAKRRKVIESASLCKARAQSMLVECRNICTRNRDNVQRFKDKVKTEENNLQKYERQITLLQRKIAASKNNIDILQNKICVLDKEYGTQKEKEIKLLQTILLAKRMHTAHQKTPIIPNNDQPNPLPVPKSEAITITKNILPNGLIKTCNSNLTNHVLPTKVLTTTPEKSKDMFKSPHKLNNASIPVSKDNKIEKPNIVKKAVPLPHKKVKKLNPIQPVEYNEKNEGATTNKPQPKAKVSTPILSFIISLKPVDYISFTDIICKEDDAKDVYDLNQKKLNSEKINLSNAINSKEIIPQYSIPQYAQCCNLNTNLCDIPPSKTKLVKYNHSNSIINHVESRLKPFYYDYPLAVFHEYRLSPFYRSKYGLPISVALYRFLSCDEKHDTTLDCKRNINHDKFLCPYALQGKCLDSSCKHIHCFKNFNDLISNKKIWSLSHTLKQSDSKIANKMPAQVNRKNVKNRTNSKIFKATQAIDFETFIMAFFTGIAMEDSKHIILKNYINDWKRMCEGKITPDDLLILIVSQYNEQIKNTHPHYISFQPSEIHKIHDTKQSSSTITNETIIQTKFSPAVWLLYEELLKQTLQAHQPTIDTKNVSPDTNYDAEDRYYIDKGKKSTENTAYLSQPYITCGNIICAYLKSCINILQTISHQDYREKMDSMINFVCEIIFSFNTFATDNKFRVGIQIFNAQHYNDTSNAKSLLNLIERFACIINSPNDNHAAFIATNIQQQNASLKTIFKMLFDRKNIDVDVKNDELSFIQYVYSLYLMLSFYGYLMIIQTILTGHVKSFENMKWIHNDSIVQFFKGGLEWINQFHMAQSELIVDHLSLFLAFSSTLNDNNKSDMAFVFQLVEKVCDGFKENSSIKLSPKILRLIFMLVWSFKIPYPNLEKILLSYFIPKNSVDSKEYKLHTSSGKIDVKKSNQELETLLCVLIKSLNLCDFALACFYVAHFGLFNSYALHIKSITSDKSMEYILSQQLDAINCLIHHCARFKLPIEPQFIPLKHNCKYGQTDAIVQPNEHNKFINFFKTFYRKIMIQAMNQNLEDHNFHDVLKLYLYLLTWVMRQPLTSTNTYQNKDHFLIDDGWNEFKTTLLENVEIYINLPKNGSLNEEALCRNLIFTNFRQRNYLALLELKRKKYNVDLGQDQRDDFFESFTYDISAYINKLWAILNDSIPAREQDYSLFNLYLLQECFTAILCFILLLMCESSDNSKSYNVFKPILRNFQSLNQKYLDPKSEYYIWLDKVLQSLLCHQSEPDDTQNQIKPKKISYTDYIINTILSRSSSIPSIGS